MVTLLDNPIVQSAVLPFLTALALGLVLIFIVPRWFSLALPASFYPVAFLIAGLQVLPLNSTRKILVIGVLAVIAALAADKLSVAIRRYVFIAVVVTISIAWVLWPVYTSNGINLMQLIGGMVYSLWLVVAIDYQHKHANTQQLTAMMLAASIAVIATLGASALLGQLSGALAAVLGALLLVLVLTNKPARSDLMVLPAVLLSTLLSLAAVFYSGLNWYSLISLGVLPLIAFIPMSVDNRWLRLVIQLVLMLPLVAISVYFAMPAVSDSGYY